MEIGGDMLEMIIKRIAELELEVDKWEANPYTDNEQKELMRSAKRQLKANRSILKEMME